MFSVCWSFSAIMISVFHCSSKLVASKLFHSLYKNSEDVISNIIGHKVIKTIYNFNIFVAPSNFIFYLGLIKPLHIFRLGTISTHFTDPRPI